MRNEHLEKKIKTFSKNQFKEIWKKHSNAIEHRGLEAELANLTQSEQILKNAIKVVIVRYILKNKEKLYKATQLIEIRY